MARLRLASATALSLVHRLHARDRDVLPLRDKVVGKGLRIWHPFDPGCSPFELTRRGVDREVAWRDVFELVPVDRERNRRTWSHPWAVRRDHGRAASARRVEEDLALAVLLHERRC